MPEFTTDSSTDLPADVELPDTLPAQREAVQAFFRGYVTAMLWANVTWDDSDTGDAPEGFSASDIELTADQLRELAGDALDFVADQYVDLLGYVLRRARSVGGLLQAWEHAGHDFALTRNGHGAGFWDRGLGNLGGRLTQATKPYGEAWIDAAVEDGQIQTWIQ